MKLLAVAAALCLSVDSHSVVYGMQRCSQPQDWVAPSCFEGKRPLAPTFIAGGLSANVRPAESSGLDTCRTPSFCTNLGRSRRAGWKYLPVPGDAVRGPRSRRRRFSPKAMRAATRYRLSRDDRRSASSPRDWRSKASLRFDTDECFAFALNCRSCRAARNIAALRRPNKRPSWQSLCRRQSKPRSCPAPRSPARPVCALWLEPPHPTEPPGPPDATTIDVSPRRGRAPRPPQSRGDCKAIVRGSTLLRSPGIKRPVQ
jgi:hypothetical protein